MDHEIREKTLQSKIVQHIGVPIWQASNAYVGAVYRRAGERGFEEITESDSDVLAFVPVTGTNMVSLAKRRGTSKQATQEKVQRLVRKGALKIEQCPTDKRAKSVRFTARGLDFVECLQQIKKEMQAEAEARVGTSELQELSERLSVLVELFSEPA